MKTKFEQTPGGLGREALVLPFWMNGPAQISDRTGWGLAANANTANETARLSQTGGKFEAKWNRQMPLQDGVGDKILSIFF